MSDESAASPDISPNPPAEGAPRVRRISNPRIKKPTKTAPEAPAEVIETPAPVSQRKSPGFPDFSESSDELPTRGDWPEPEAESSGASTSPENPKRKRRRKKGKGGNSSQNPQASTDLESAAEPQEQAPSTQAQAPRPQSSQNQNQAPRTKLDPELLAKFAWKIYLSEVSEEGVALIGDNDAKELSRRCFRLAEIFMEEQTRRR